MKDEFEKEGELVNMTIHARLTIFSKFMGQSTCFLSFKLTNLYPDLIGPISLVFCFFIISHLHFLLGLVDNKYVSFKDLIPNANKIE